MVQFNPKLSSDEISIFSKISVLSNQYNAINLGQGFPDFAVAPELKEKVDYYLKADKDQYAPMQGVLKLREVLAQKYTTAYRTPLDPTENISITAGATQAIFTCIQAVIHQGDEVIIIEPAYDSYAPTIVTAGGKVVPVLLGMDFLVNWKAVKNAVTDQTKMIIFNNPHNPTGQIWKEEDFLALSQIVKDTNILLLSDEVYEHLVYDEQEHLSILNYPELFERSFATFSFGKTFHATGWKMGYIIAPAPLMKAFRNIHQWNVFSVNSFLQYALADHLSSPSSYAYLNDFYQQKRDFFSKGMKGTGFKEIKSAGSYFQLYDYSAISELPDIQFAEWLIKEHGVATIPISPFCSDDTPWSVVRFCFAKKEDTLSKAIKRLHKV